MYISSVFYPPVFFMQLMNFSVVPLHLRIPFVAGVSFAWWVVEMTAFSHGEFSQAGPQTSESGNTLLIRALHVLGSA
jgi:hypothetical protein